MHGAVEGLASEGLAVARRRHCDRRSSRSRFSSCTRSTALVTSVHAISWLGSRAALDGVHEVALDGSPGLRDIAAALRQRACSRTCRAGPWVHLWATVSAGLALVRKAANSPAPPGSCGKNVGARAVWARPPQVAHENDDRRRAAAAPGRRGRAASPVAPGQGPADDERSGGCRLSRCTVSVEPRGLPGELHGPGWRSHLRCGRAGARRRSGSAPSGEMPRQPTGEGHPRDIRVQLAPPSINRARRKQSGWSAVTGRMTAATGPEAQRRRDQSKPHIGASSRAPEPGPLGAAARRR